LKRRIGIDLPQRRFGFIGIEKGFITADHLYEALIKQRAQETGSTERRLLGMILKCVIHRHPFNAMVGNPGLEDGYGSSIKTAPYLGADV
jgi:hypothetical protein